MCMSTPVAQENSHTQSLMESKLEDTAVPEMEHEARHAVQRMPSRHDNSTSPFLELPAELRNRIYLYIFDGYRFLIDVKSTSNNDMLQVVPCAWDESKPALKQPSHTFALLKTCRQIHSETRLLPFELNTFELQYPKNLDIWMLTLSKQLHSVRTLYIDTFDASKTGTGRAASQVACLPSFGGLQTVQVGIMMYHRRPGWFSSEWAPIRLQIYEECKAKLEKEINGVMGRKLDFEFFETH